MKGGTDCATHAAPVLEDGSKKEKMKGGTDCATHAAPVLEGGSKKEKMKYADSKTRSGKNRQVWEGKAEMTGPGGLMKKDLIKNKDGKIVSKKMSKNAKSNPYMKKLAEAKKKNADSFKYNGKEYVKTKAKTGMIIYKAK